MVLVINVLVEPMCTLITMFVVTNVNKIMTWVLQDGDITQTYEDMEQEATATEKICNTEMVEFCGRVYSQFGEYLNEQGEGNCDLSCINDATTAKMLQDTLACLWSKDPRPAEGIPVDADRKPIAAVMNDTDSWWRDTAPASRVRA